MTPTAPVTIEADTTMRSAHTNPVYEKLVLGYFLASLGFALAGMLAGMFYSLQFLQIYPFTGIELFSPGRWRIVHTTIVTYGFIGNACLGALHWIVPRLTGRPILTNARSLVLMMAWQLILLATVAGVILGQTRAVPWGEAPPWIAPFITLTLAMISAGLFIPFFKTQRPRPIALWYFAIPLIALAPTHAIGSFLPQHFASNTATGITGLGHMVSLFVMPLGYGFLYEFVPLATQRPIWSPALARAGWLAAALSFPIHTVCVFLCDQGTLPPSLAEAIPTLWTVGTAVTVIINVFATAINQRGIHPAHPAMRWFLLGTLLYFVGCVQNVFGLASSLYSAASSYDWASSDWTIAHSHLIAFGAFGFWLFGIMTYLLPKLLGATKWYRTSWNVWHFRLTGIGLLIMFVDLAAAGVVQQHLWHSLTPWEQSLAASVPFWVVRATIGFVMIAGHMVLICHIAMTTIHGKKARTPEAETPDTPAAKSESLLVAGILILAVSLATVGFMRWNSVATRHDKTLMDLAHEGVTHEFIELAERFPNQFYEYYPNGPTIESFASALALGRATFEAEACWHCHTQRVRAVSQDIARWGPATRADEYQNVLQRRASLPTRRIGPDLSKEAGRRSNDWHLAHFFKPTDVVPTSVMPAYPWFFDEDDYPNRRGLAVITYMQWLGSTHPESSDNHGEGPHEPAATTVGHGTQH